MIGASRGACHLDFTPPADLYAPLRQNSCGIEFGERAALGKLVADIAAERAPASKAAMATSAQAEAAVVAARTGFARWSRTAAVQRAEMLERGVGLLVGRMEDLLERVRSVLVDAVG